MGLSGLILRLFWKPNSDVDRNKATIKKCLSWLAGKVVNYGEMLLIICAWSDKLYVILLLVAKTARI